MSNTFFSELEIEDRTLWYQWGLNNWFKKHKHDYWEFVLSIKGVCTQAINDNKDNYYPMEAALIKPWDSHQIFKGEQGDYYLNIFIDEGFFKSICDFCGENLYAQIKEMPLIHLRFQDFEYEQIQKMILKLGQREADGILTKRLIALYIIEKIYNELILEKDDCPDELRILLRTLSDTKNIGMRVADVVKISPYSYNYLARIFKKAMGVTINEYLYNQKMEFASFNLRHTNISVLELSNILGFDSLSHFIRLFKKKYGMSPHQYRKNSAVDIEAQAQEMEKDKN